MNKKIITVLVLIILFAGTPSLVIQSTRAQGACERSNEQIFPSITLSELPDNYILFKGVWGPKYNGSYYSYYAEGTVFGKLSGKATWYEEGYQEGLYFEGMVICTLTTDDGRYFIIELGTKDQPYTCVSERIWYPSRKIYKMFAEGPLYINGEYSGHYEEIWYGYWDVWLVPM